MKIVKFKGVRHQSFGGIGGRGKIRRNGCHQRCVGYNCALEEGDNLQKREVEDQLPHLIKVLS